ncbi:hypothetical protein [Chromobacterium amazonense]|uniref:hypothetical protein n=1 Tax=Chromobacterium amazonense TaxID=1382803 RepID=UPI0031F6FAFC
MSIAIQMPAAIEQSKARVAEVSVNDKKLEQAAVQFESLLIAQLQSEMRKSIRSINPESSETRERMGGELMDYMDKQLADQMAEQRAFGVADYLIKTLS